VHPGGLWSHQAGWGELLVPVPSTDPSGLDLGEGWPDRWLVARRPGGEVVSSPLRELARHRPLSGSTADRGRKPGSCPSPSPAPGTAGSSAKPRATTGFPPRPRRPARPAADPRPARPGAPRRRRLPHLHRPVGGQRAPLHVLAPRPRPRRPRPGRRGRRARHLPDQRRPPEGPGQAARRRPCCRRAADRRRHHPGHPPTWQAPSPARRSPQAEPPQQVRLVGADRTALLRVLPGNARRRRPDHTCLPANIRPPQPQGTVPGRGLLPRAHPRAP
jgi:hypothetical protein